MLEFQPIASFEQDIQFENNIIKKGNYFHVDALKEARILRQDPSEQSQEELFGGFEVVCKNYSEVLHFYNIITYIEQPDFSTKNLSDEEKTQIQNLSSYLKEHLEEIQKNEEAI